MLPKPNESTVNRLDMTRRFHGLSSFDGILQQEALSLTKQRPSVSQVPNGLQPLNINGLAGAAEAHGQDINLGLAGAAEGHGQEINLRGTTSSSLCSFLSLPLPNPLVFPLNNSGTNGLDMTGSLYGTPAGTKHLPLPSPSLTAYSEES